jgi:hypothetical protein
LNRHLNRKPKSTTGAPKTQPGMGLLHLIGYSLCCIFLLTGSLLQAQAPTNISVTPASGSGATQTFAFVGASPNGYGYINMMQMLFSFGVDGRQACYVQYSPGSNTLTLIGDDGNTPQSATMGTNAALDNSQCHVNVQGSSAPGSGNNLTVNVAVTFKAPFVGQQNTYMTVSDNAGLNSAWQLMGTWTGYSASTALPTMSVSPPPGTGMSQTFTFHTSDVNSYKYVLYEGMILNTSSNGAGACYVGYSVMQLHHLPEVSFTRIA